MQTWRLVVGLRGDRGQQRRGDGGRVVEEGKPGGKQHHLDQKRSEKNKYKQAKQINRGYLGGEQHHHSGSKQTNKYNKSANLRVNIPKIAS